MTLLDNKPSLIKFDIGEFYEMLSCFIINFDRTVVKKNALHLSLNSFSFFFKVITAAIKTFILVTMIKTVT